VLGKCIKTCVVLARPHELSSNVILVIFETLLWLHGMLSVKGGWYVLSYPGCGMFYAILNIQ
jgi:hypothetical protein